jgi:hypothetical protein
MMDRREYYDARLRLLEAPSQDFDFDYSKVKFFNSPELFTRGSGVFKIGSFIKKYIHPLAEKTGIEIINESPDKYFNNTLGGGYSVDALKTYFNSNIETITKDIITPICGNLFIENIAPYMDINN